MMKRSVRNTIRTVVAAVVVIGAGFGADRIISDAPREAAQNSIAPGSRHYPDLDKVNMADPLTPSQFKQYEGFSLSFNKDNRTPNYVAWELLGTEADGVAATRTNRFWQDSDIKGCPVTKDYTGSGYDRGHMCPAADQKWSAQAMEDCFSLANICPQNHNINAGIWADLEDLERQWARRDSAIVIVAGPIYDDSDTERIGSAGVRVPHAFFKVILAPYLDTPRAIGFIFPNQTNTSGLTPEKLAMTVDEVEEKTGLDFFFALDDQLETQVEKECSFREWTTNIKPIGK